MKSFIDGINLLDFMSVSLDHAINENNNLMLTIKFAVNESDFYKNFAAPLAEVLRYLLIPVKHEKFSGGLIYIMGEKFSFRGFVVPSEFLDSFYNIKCLWLLLAFYDSDNKEILRAPAALPVNNIIIFPFSAGKDSLIPLNSIKISSVIMCALMFGNKANKYSKFYNQFV